MISNFASFILLSNSHIIICFLLHIFVFVRVLEFPYLCLSERNQNQIKISKSIALDPHTPRGELSGPHVSGLRIRYRHSSSWTQQLSG